tara:strand:+ start:90 stop:320 length:231 start_codon:yes stop_codon:yes gene_type:complete
MPFVELFICSKLVKGNLLCGELSTPEQEPRLSPPTFESQFATLSLEEFSKLLQQTTTEPRPRTTEQKRSFLNSPIV